MFNYILYRLGQSIALSLPLKVVYWIAVFISDIHYIFAYKDRRAVTANLKVIFPDKTNRQIHKIRRECFRNFAKYLADFFRFSKLNADYIEKNIKIENIHYLDEALGRGKGAIILSVHIGNWELGGVAVALRGYPLWAVALPHKNKKVNEFFNSQREAKGMKVIQLGNAVKASLGILRENKVLALVGDRNFGERGIEIDFFGRPAFLPMGPAVFALKTGASIVPGFMLRNDDDSFTLKIEKPLQAINTKNKDKDIADLMMRYKIIFQDYIRRYPAQWYVFREFWNSKQ